VAVLCLAPLAAAPASAFAQGVAAQPAAYPAEEVRLYNACLADGMAEKNTIRTADKVIHTCHESAAQNLYGYLDKSGAPRTVDKQRTGTYTFLAIPQGGRCFDKYDDAYEVPTSTFGCSIYLPVKGK
jgi:hypothetical protein